MKIQFHTRLICGWLAILVLLSSTGFGMVEHWCQMRGHTKTILLTEKGCETPCKSDEIQAPLSGEQSIKKMPCCKTTVSYEHLDVSRVVLDQHVPVAGSPAEFIPNPEFRLLLAALLPTETATTGLLLTDTPIHRTGRFRLISLCSWLI
jgi:hypothetical protein